MINVGFDWLTAPDDEDDEQKPKRFYGVTTGTVVNILDPLVLGRVQVQLKFVDDLDLSPWCRVATMMAGIASGTYFIPNIMDEVLVAFEHGDINVPYVIGSLWNAAAPPPLPSPIPQIREIRTLAGNQIMIMDIPPTIQLLTPSGQILTLGPAGIVMTTLTGVQMLVGDTMINVTPAGVNITGKTVNVTASGVMNLTGATVNLTATTMCNITAPMVKINS